MPGTRQHRLLSILGIDWMATSAAVAAPFWIAAIGIAISFVAPVGSGAGERLLIGLVYGLFIEASIIVHQLGGAIAGALVGAPMRSVIFTATLPYNVYDDSREFPGSVHIIRGLGEPLANFLVGAIMLILYVAGLDSHFVLFLAALNLAFFVIAMTPLPTMHGGVVLKHMRGRAQG
jgi:hypothetical protein